VRNPDCNVTFLQAAGAENSNMGPKTTNQVAFTRLGIWVCILFLLCIPAFSLEIPVPRAHWRLNELQGLSAPDAEGNYHGTLVNGPIWQPLDGRIGGTLEFDGHDDYVDCGAHADLNITGAISVAVWVFIYEVDETWQAVVTKGDSAWRLSVYENTRRFHFAVTGPPYFYVNGAIEVPLNEWHHICGTYDGEYIRLYIDGVEDPDSPVYYPDGITSNDYPVMIGENAEISEREWSGLIDDVWIFDVALTDEQVAFLAHPTFHVDAVNGDDSQDGSARPFAYATARNAIEKAQDGDTILLWPGVYREVNLEVINFQEKTLNVASAADAAVLESELNWAVVFQSGQQADCILENVVIRNSHGGIHCFSSNPTIRNVTVVNNQRGLEALGGSTPSISNSIFWNKTYDFFYVDTPPTVTYSCTKQPIAGEGNISEDPLFVFADPNHPNPNQWDFHLRSSRGRYQPNSSDLDKGVWILDEQTSPCVAAGDPRANPMAERMPNGGRINMGAYGNTYYAGMHEWPLAGDINFDGTINIMDFVLLSRKWLDTLPWRE
jgi:concanavalin A-like lectin/glucanase superfamily protein/parallel beta helix pectate lyase-like protein